MATHPRPDKCALCQPDTPEKPCISVPYPGDPTHYLAVCRDCARNITEQWAKAEGFWFTADAKRRAGKTT